MRGSSWLLLLLLLSAAAAKQTTVQQQEKDEKEVLNGGLLQESKAEGQEQDLLTAATGYGGDQHHKAGYHDSSGYKGNKGHKAQKGYKKNQYGDHAKAQYSGYHDTQGKKYKGHDDKEKYYGDSHKGKKGKKGHHYGSKGHQNKGHKDKGFKNVYHKEEYHHSKKFYDDHDNKKYHSSYDDLDSYFKAHKGNDHKGGHYKSNSNGNKDTESSETESEQDSQPNNSARVEATRSLGERGNPKSKATLEELPNRVVNEKTGGALHTENRKREDRDVQSKKMGNELLLQDQGKREGKHLDESGKEDNEMKFSKIKSKGTLDTRQKKQQTNSQKKTVARKTGNKRENPDNKKITRDKNLKHSDKEDEKGKNSDSQKIKSATKTGNWKGNPGDKNTKDLNVSKDKNVKHSDNKKDERVKKTNPQSKKNNTEIRTHKKPNNPSDENQIISKMKNPRKGEKNQRKTKVKKEDSKTSELAKPKNIQQSPRNSKTIRVKKLYKDMNEPDPPNSLKGSSSVRSKKRIQNNNFLRSKTRQLRNAPALAIIRLNRRICRLKCRICFAYNEQELLEYHEHNRSKLKKRRSKGGTTKTKKNEMLYDKARLTQPLARDGRLQAVRKGNARDSKESQESKGSRESPRYPAKQVGVTEAHLREKKNLKSNKKNEEKLKRNPRQQLTKNTEGKQQNSEAKISQRKAEESGTAAKKENVLWKSKSLSEIDGYRIRNVNKSPTISPQNKEQTEKEKWGPTLTKPQDLKKTTKIEVSSKIVSPAGRNKGKENGENVFRSGPSRQKMAEGDEDNKPKFTTHRENDSLIEKKRKTESTSNPKGNQKYMKNCSKSTGRRLTKGAVEEPSLREAGKSRPRSSVGSTTPKKDKTGVTNTGGKINTLRKTMHKHPSNSPRQGGQQESKKPSRITKQRKRQQDVNIRPKSLSVKDTGVKVETPSEKLIEEKEI